MSFKDNIALLLTPNMFWDERPAMTSFMENEVQEGINTAFNLINAECGNLPYKVLEYNAPHLANPETKVDVNNDLYRNDYELEQFKQAIITQTQYTLNMGNDFSQGSSTLSTGGMSATIQRPEKRDIIAPGVLKFLQNARLYQLQVYTSATQKCNTNACDELGRLLTVDRGDDRYVQKYQSDASVGQVAFINNNKQVSFANPSELSFNVLRAQEILDRDGQYRQIKDVRNLAGFGQQGTDAMTRSETIDTIKAYKQYDDNFVYMNEDIIGTGNESSRFVDYGKSKQDNNKGHSPQLDTNGVGWEKIYNRDVRAKYILDPIDNVYKTINQFDVNYFGGMKKDEIYAAINASGTSGNPNTTYAKGFVVIFVDSTNALEGYESLQDNNKGHNPETDTDGGKKLPTPAIDVNDVINQIKPYIQQIVDDSIDTKLEPLKTSITTDFAGSEYYFADEQAFEQFLQNNPKLQKDGFDDIPSVDLSGYAKLDGNNTYSGRNTFNSILNINGGVQIDSTVASLTTGLNVDGANGYISFQQPTALIIQQGARLEVRGDIKVQNDSGVPIPNQDNQIANKKYVDDSTSDMNIANKKYVDDNINSLLNQNNTGNGGQTFGHIPKVPNKYPTEDYELTPKRWVDEQINNIGIKLKAKSFRLTQNNLTGTQTKKLANGYAWGCYLNNLEGIDPEKIVNVKYYMYEGRGLTDYGGTLFNFSGWIYGGDNVGKRLILSGISHGSGEDDYGKFFTNDTGLVIYYYE